MLHAMLLMLQLYIGMALGIQAEKGCIDNAALRFFQSWLSILLFISLDISSINFLGSMGLISLY